MTRYVPKGYTAGTTYPIGDLPTREESGVADSADRRNLRAVPTGEKRVPNRGEWYLSGGPVSAYRAPNDFLSEYMIARLVRVERVPVQETYRVVPP
jgi:hypothetical protein